MSSFSLSAARVAFAPVPLSFVRPPVKTRLIVVLPAPDSSRKPRARLKEKRTYYRDDGNFQCLVSPEEMDRIYRGRRYTA